MSAYSQLPIAELRNLLKEKNISGYSSMRKAEMIAALEQADEATRKDEKTVPKAEKTAVKAEKQAPKEKSVDKSEKSAPKEEKAAPKTEKSAPKTEKAAPKAEKQAPKTETASEQPKTRSAKVVKRVVASGKAPETTKTDAPEQKPAETAGTPVKAATTPVNARENNAPENVPASAPEAPTASAEPQNAPANRPDARRVVSRRVVVSENPERAALRRDNEERRGEIVRREGAGNTGSNGSSGNAGADPTDSGIVRKGIFEICSENYGFLRNDNYLPSEHDVYISPAMIRRYNLTTGDFVEGTLKKQGSGEKFVPLHHITKINDKDPEFAMRRRRFDRLTPVFPHERMRMEYPGCNVAMRIVDLLSPIGKGQRGMIVSQPKAGKTTLLKQVAKSILMNHKSVHLIILLIDERPEEVTDFKDFVKDYNAEVIYSTFDEEPNRHRRVSEMTMERAKRLVEYGEDVVILLDSITRLARAYNLTCVSSGRTLSGGLDPNALYMPKKFFGAARCMKEGGSLTILATALVDTGSRMDDVIYEEFKGTGNMELVLNRDLSERRIFPAIDLPKSSTRREDLLLLENEQRASTIMRKSFNGKSAEESIEKIINLFVRTKSNLEFMQYVLRRE